MRRYLLMLALILGLVMSCVPKEVTLPNKNLKYEKRENTYNGKLYKGIVTYKGQPYTGKIKMSLKDKIGGWSGSISLKDGHLDGISEINSKNGTNLKFTVIDGKFEGDYGGKVEEMGTVYVFFKNGRPEIMKSDVKRSGMNLKQSFTIAADGKISGEIIRDGNTYVFKDGVGEMDGLTLKLTLNEENRIVTEFYRGDELLQKDVAKSDTSPGLLEQLAFPSFFNGEEKDMSLVY